MEEKKRKDEEFYNHLFVTENTLNKQLRTSEEAGAARNKSNGDVLTEEFAKRRAYLERQKKEDELNNEKVGRQTVTD